MDREQYLEELKEYMKKQGPNPEKTFFSALGWYTKHKIVFDESMRKKGVVFEGDEHREKEEKSNE